MFYQYLILVRT